jgi:hypothetical protein
MRHHYSIHKKKVVGPISNIRNIPILRLEQKENGQPTDPTTYKIYYTLVEKTNAESGYVRRRRKIAS